MTTRTLCRKDLRVREAPFTPAVPSALTKIVEGSTTSSQKDGLRGYFDIVPSWN